MAKQLYDYWFVQFDFPDENGKPYKSSGGKMVWNEKLKREIPKDWCTAGIFDELSVQYGFPFSTELFTETPTNIPIVRIRDIVENSISAYSSEKTDIKYKLQKQDLLIGMDGNFHMNYWNDNISYLNQRSVRLRAKISSTVSILQARFDIAPYIKAKELRAKGSTVGHLSDKDLKDLYVLVSPNHQIRKIFDNLLVKIIENRCETTALSTLRDSLLPLLMNGQVSLNYDLSVVALLWRTPCRLVVGYRPFLICSREEGMSLVGACSGRCNQSRTVEKRLRVFVLGLGHGPCSLAVVMTRNQRLFLRGRGLIGRK